MATQIDTGPRAHMASDATIDLLWLAQNGYGGAAGEKLVEHMIAGPDTSLGELELRLALGTLAAAQRAILERLARVDAMQQ
jgi:hypothetical protein